ncbi:50S ribosomal protein L25 [Picochlorum sp. SENEW3]|nr:50S ribosomal protein L25 [Picochlorum sp. SENEW3]
MGSTSLLRRHASGLLSPWIRDIQHDGSKICTNFMQSMQITTSTASLQGEGNVMALQGAVRKESGSRAAAKLRESGRVPGTLFSLGGDTMPEDKILLSFDKKEIASLYNKIGSYGWGCQVFDVHALHGDEPKVYRALGRQIHITAATGQPENVTMISLSEDRLVKVNVPLKTFGKEVSPGIRAGGRVNWIRRTVPCLVRGYDIPQFFEVDISELDVNDKVLWTSLEVPTHVTIALKDPRQPVLKMARK